MSYAKKMQQLEEIKEIINQTDDLEKSMELYTKAMKLIAELNEQLEKMESELQSDES